VFVAVGCLNCQLHGTRAAVFDGFTDGMLTRTAVMPGLFRYRAAAPGREELVNTTQLSSFAIGASAK
ncbi:MAG TPA: hypothetical protein VJX67_05410, partial [Blastocatellia bacterium]|nr:hypothetical protein [Blastocatellia bacterium]